MVYAGRWYSWDEIRAMATIMRTRTRLVPEDRAIAVICKHPLLLGAVLGLLADRRGPVLAVAPADAIQAELAGVRRPSWSPCQRMWRERACATPQRWAARRSSRCTTVVSLAGPAGAVAPDETASRAPLAYPAGTAFVLQTSGTTGPPKRVPLSYANIEANINAMQVRVGHGQGPAAAQRRDPEHAAVPRRRHDVLLPQLRKGQAARPARQVRAAALGRVRPRLCGPLRGGPRLRSPCCWTRTSRESGYPH